MTKTYLSIPRTCTHMHFRALTCPPSNTRIDCSFSHEKPKCHGILHWCAHPSSSSTSSKPSKIYFLCWPRVWLAALEKLCGCPDIHQLAWTILGGRKETGSSDHLSLWLMLQRVFWIWHVLAEMMPACLVLTYWAGRQTCIDIKHGTLKRNQLLSPSQAGINNKLCYLSWPHTLSPSPL